MSLLDNNIKKLHFSFEPRTYGSKTLLLLIRTAQDTFGVKGERHDGNPPAHYIKTVHESL